MRIGDLTPEWIETVPFRTGDLLSESDSRKKLVVLIKLEGLELIKDDLLGLFEDEVGPPFDDLSTRAGLDRNPILVFGPFDGVFRKVEVGLMLEFGLCVKEDDTQSVSNLSGEAFKLFCINDRFPRRSGLISGPGGVIGRNGS